jgi:xanthine dehydrogenase small subunit
MSATFTITINGIQETVQGVPPTTTLLEFLRSSGWVGTKEGCAEGDCGACTVAVVGEGTDGKAHYTAVNSCLVPVAALADRQVITVEGVTRDAKALHPVQEAMVQTGGSQCGYCTPGFIMSLFAAYYDGKADDHAVEGNLCRCTGYLPIRKAAASLGAPKASDPFVAALQTAQETAPADSYYEYAGNRFHHPLTLSEVFGLLEAHPQARLIAGGTDLGVEINKFHRAFPVLVSLERLQELKSFEDTPEYLEVGAGVTLSHLMARAHGIFPAFDEMLYWFAARQIRNRATLGGNLANASPIGDLPPVLMSLGADLKLASQTGERWVSVSDFFTGYRQTLLQPGEVIASIRIPKTLPEGASRRLSQSYKVGKRGTDDISIVAATFTIDLDAQERVVQARLAYGGVAATPVRALEVEAWLIGRPWTLHTAQEAARALRQTFRPLSDVRGTADYRLALTGNLFEKFFVEFSPQVISQEVNA